MAFAEQLAGRQIQSWLLAAAILTFASSVVLGAAGHKGAVHTNKISAAEHHKHPSEPKHGERAPGPRTILSTEKTGSSPPLSELDPDLAAVKQAIQLVRQHKFSDVTMLAASVRNPVAQKLIAWAALRDGENPAGFDDYNNFIEANPDWPSIALLRRRAEARLWQERRDGPTLRHFVGTHPASAPGRLALARLLLSEGDRAGAARQVQAVWHGAELSPELETVVTNVFHDELTTADDILRMDYRIGAKDFGAAMRMAKRLGPAQVAIVKACEAAEANTNKSAALLAAIPSEAQTDLGYALCRLHWLLAHDDVAAAVKLLAEVSGGGLQRQATDEWWRECRTLARRLLDMGDPNTAYLVVREAPTPANPYYRAEFQFMPGWIALRFLSDPATALRHFAKIDEGSSDPIVLARAAYWRGRAFEASGRAEEMKAQYARAARYPTAYYGQLARARIGASEIALRPLPLPNDNLESGYQEVVRAAEMLYALGELDLVLTFVTELAESSTKLDALTAVGEVTARHYDAQAMLALGKTALARGLAMDRYAFPEIGVPSFSSIAPAIDDCMVYSIVRTESGFDQRDTSPANAVGLMQVTPEAGRDTAQRFRVGYDWQRLIADPVYNMQMGAAEVSALFKEYAGSYVMTFAGYNAGRGRVRQWVAQHGDPRDPKVDAVDWVERIPSAETRNYVQRVMENLQVYAARMGANVATLEPNLHRVTTIESRANPVVVDAIPH